MNGFLTRWILCPWQVTVYKFVKSINWSALANLGNSRVSQLTILMPVVGYLVIFNSTLTEWLGTKLPNQVISAPPDFWDAMFDRNLLLLYFGLLIFGLGVGLYNAVVPSQIKRFPSIEDYITAMEGIGTRNLAIGSFDNVVRMYFENVQGEDGIPMFSSQNASFPGDVSGDFHRLIAEMFNALEEGEWWGSEEEEGSRFHYVNGHLKTDEIIEVMYSGRRIDGRFRKVMYDEAVVRSKDIYYVEHKALEYSKPISRIITFVLYASGLLLTSFPSFVTSAIILRSW